MKECISYGRNNGEALTPSFNLMLRVVLLAAGLIFVAHDSAVAQHFSILHSFTTLRPGTISSLSGLPTGTNEDGAVPNARLVRLGNVLYGTAASGGVSSNGTVFAVNTDGTNYRVLHTFAPNSPGPKNHSIYGATNDDGAFPYGGLALSGNILFGTTEYGGSGGVGTVFRMSIDGSGFTNLHNFNMGEGGLDPLAGVTVSEGVLYGTTSLGGVSGLNGGTVFRLNADGTGFRPLVSFPGGTGGSNPYTGVVLGGNTLYGTTSNGGHYGNGIVFAIQTDGTGFTNLHSFNPTSPPQYTNIDGAAPRGLLLLSGTNLYGTAPVGGKNGYGTVFALRSDGTAFTTLYSFSAPAGRFPNLTNNDGAQPGGGLTLVGDTLFGATAQAGSFGGGTLFAIQTDGTAFSTLHDFPAAAFPTYANVDGADPHGCLVLADNTLFGTAGIGGTGGEGTVFSISLRGPDLNIVQDQTAIILRWPADAAGFALESTLELGPSAMWQPTLTNQVTADGLNSVTKLITGSHVFFRLRK